MVFVPVVNVTPVADQYDEDAAVLSARMEMSPVGVPVIDCILNTSCVGVPETVGVKDQA